MARFLWICLGGAAGTGARYLLEGWLLRAAGPGFPWGTLAVNVIGSFLLGLIMHVSLTTGLLSPALRLALTTGVMGGFTTYSTFNYETLQYLQQNEWLAAFSNVAATLLACLAAGALGVLGGKLLAGS
ncbi:MAG: fluoride efflux transporter CrcB [Thermoanaerobaculia bacterium]